MKEDSRKIESEEVLIDIGQSIKKLRLSKGLSQAEVAESCGISQSAYAKIESGKTKNITIDIGRLIAEFLEISFVELFDISPSKGFSSAQEWKNTEQAYNEMLSEQNNELFKRLEEKNTLINSLISEKKNLKDFLVMQFVSHYSSYIGLIDDLIDQAPNEKFKETLHKKRINAISFEKTIQSKFIKLGLFTKQDIHIYIDEMKLMGLQLKDINEME